MKNYLIINRKPHKFENMRMVGRTAVFLDEDKPISYGVLAVDDTVYAVLYCDEVCNVTMVVDRGGVRRVVTVLWGTREEYDRGKEALHNAYGRRISRQDKRINRYAEAIAEKLDIGVRLQVTDTANTSSMGACPDCGTFNPSGSVFCFECGAEIA